MVKPRVLVVDDEPGILKFVGANLRHEGYEVVEASDGEEALRSMEVMLPDLVILDIRIPKLDGVEACRRIREWSQVPIIMLSAIDDAGDKVRCFDLGADDYLSKPFSVEELMARVRAVFRRTKASAVPPAAPNFVSEELEVNFAQRRVIVSGQEVKLTSTEFNLLSELVNNAGKVLTHRMLLGSVWGPEYGDENEYVRVFVARLRRKIEPDPSSPTFITTISGTGYRFELPEKAQRTNGRETQFGAG